MCTFMYIKKANHRTFRRQDFVSSIYSKYDLYYYLDLIGMSSALVLGLEFLSFKVRREETGWLGEVRQMA